MIKNILLLSIISFASISSFSQKNIISEKEAVEFALKGNPQMKIASLKIEKQKSLKGASINFKNLEILVQSPYSHNFKPAILQAFDFPTVYIQQAKAQNNNVKVAQAEQSITTNNLIFQVRSNYNTLNYLIEKNNTLKRQDSIFSYILEVNDVRYRVGQISNLEKINGEAYYKQIQFSLIQNTADLQNAQIQLAIQIGKPEDTSFVSTGKLSKIIDYEVNHIPDTTFETNPLSTYYKQQKFLAQRQLKIDKNKMLPGLIVGYFDQWGGPAKYQFSAGVTLPIWFWAYSSRINASKKDVEIVGVQSTYNNYQLKGEYSKELAQFRNYNTALQYFESVGLAQAAEIIKSARESYRLGSIGYYFYLQNINQAFQIQYNYLEALKNYNQSIITLQYLLGDQKY
jgi:outer membrane protein TolC